ncbi:hypothetical protein PHJA_002037800 [Phtheirospermum japonicum]|uniref:Uncharacterized protein n=1 Tax=Phtheirospermum japonicum TaxID=374723 RepID=A0A830CIW2_9LAMI|nr:hypothetical protein PHJA_002037800 [Phtheirospermum japonicum]
MASSSSEEENAVAPDPELVEELKKLVVEYGSELLKSFGSTDELLKKLDEFFQAAVNAFESLSCMSGRAYTKAVSILRTISYSQSCVLMLDIRMHDLIHHMFRTFFNVIRASHSDAIFSDMENIMTLIIREDVDCDESAVELAKILLSKLKKENQNVSPVTFRLAENTFKKCSDELKEYLPEAVRCLGLPVEDYADVVVSLFRDPTPSEDMDSEYAVDDTSCHGEASLSIDSGSSSLAEGNETTLASESKSVSSKGEALSGELSNPLYESKSTPSKQEASEERDAGNCLRGELVGRRVKVTYDDGEIESLDLVEECWLFIDGRDPVEWQRMFGKAFRALMKNHKELHCLMWAPLAAKNGTVLEGNTLCGHDFLGLNVGID